MNLYKKEKDIFYKESLIFFVDYFMQYKKLEKLYDNKKLIEKRSFLIKNISDFFMLNLNQNSLITSIKNNMLND